MIRLLPRSLIVSRGVRSTVAERMNGSFLTHHTVQLRVVGSIGMVIIESSDFATLVTKLPPFRIEMERLFSTTWGTSISSLT
jgi:hypothetical protein